MINKILDVETLNNLIISLGYKGKQVKSIRVYENYNLNENEWVWNNNTYDIDIISDTGCTDFVNDLEKYIGINIIIGSIG